MVAFLAAVDAEFGVGFTCPEIKARFGENVCAVEPGIFTSLVVVWCGTISVKIETGFTHQSWILFALLPAVVSHATAMLWVLFVSNGEESVQMVPYLAEGPPPGV